MESTNPYAPPRSDAFGQREATPQKPLASRGARLGARVIDGVVEGAPVMVTSVLMAALAGGGQPNMIPVVIAYFASIGIWVYQIVLLVKTGQTLARKWLGIRIVRVDGGNVSFGSHLLRGVVYLFLWWIGIWFIFRSDRRSLHDLAAETKVVEA